MMTGSFSTAALLTGTTAGVVALVTLGLAQAARRAGLAHPRTLAASVAVGMTVWLASTAALAQSGFLSAWTSLPPRWPLLPMTALGTFVLLSLTRTFRRLLAELPLWEPVALQTFRVGVELVFWRLHAEGVAPAQVTFEGRNFDALVGLTAPVVAAGIAVGWLGPRLTIAWNLFGLAMLFNAVGTVATSTPGPLYLSWAGELFTAIASWPVVWIPALLAPIGISLHVASISQALAHNAERRVVPDVTEGQLPNTTRSGIQRAHDLGGKATPPGSGRPTVRSVASARWRAGSLITVQGYIYVLEGTLIVEFADGTRRVFKTGQGFPQARSKWHRGRNDGQGVVRFLAVFFGGKDIPNVMNPPNAH